MPSSDFETSACRTLTNPIRATLRSYESDMQINLIDVGATGGLQLPWSSRQDIIGTKLSFEPNEPVLIEPGNLRYNTAVWNYDGEAEFTILGEGGMGSSLLQPNVEWVEANFDMLKKEGDPALAATFLDRCKPKGTLRCEVRKLDTILSELRSRADVPRFHFLKSDTQSGEWFVLDGARQYLSEQCLGLELECYRYPLYKGMRLQNEVFELLDEYGFDRWGWTGYQYSFNSQSEYLFLKRGVSGEEKKTVDAIRALYNTSGPNSIINLRGRSFKERVKDRLGRMFS